MVFRWTGYRPARHYVRVSFILAMLVLWLGGSPAWAATIERVDVRDDAIVVTFDQKVADASSFLLVAPKRAALDIADAPRGGGVSPGGLVEGGRGGAREGGAGVVFALTRPAVVTDGSFGA